jgi:hypothetical protein
MNGYIKLHRKILDNPIVMKSNDHLAIWMYLLLNATHKGYDTIIEGKRVTLQPGQLVTGRKVISKELKINESKVQRILKTFKTEQQIEQQTNPRCRVISILNWVEYQQGEQVNEQQVNNKRTLNKKDKNVNNIYIDQFNQFWNLYDKKVSKPKALSAYKRALKKVKHDIIMDALKNHKKTWVGREKAYIKHPTTWLNQECWNDDIEHIKPAKDKLIHNSFEKLNSGLYRAYCMKCGNELLPDYNQLKQSSHCCGVEMIPNKPNKKSQDIPISSNIFSNLASKMRV